MSATLLHHIEELITVDPNFTTEDNPLGLIKNGAILLENGVIAWLGTQTEWEETYQAETRSRFGETLTETSLAGRLVLPGLIDSHTHTIFAGDRADEFEMRLQGKTYQEIATTSGGILNTVKSTRNASPEQLKTLTRERLLRMLSRGVTTVEVKSGYGLDFESELKCLNVLQALKTELPLTLVPTYMGGHDIPPEYAGRTDAYVEELCTVQIPAIAEAKLAEFCDVFCEQGYFDVAQARRILETARAHGLKLKIHAEEFCDLGGASLAGELKSTSADHLLHISDAGISALKAGGTVATLLPGTAFFLRLTQYAPARKLLAAGVPVALATDYNPGSCAIDNLQWIMTLACLQMQMTPVEVIQAVTLNAARALDLHHDRGSLAVGKRADLAIFEAAHYTELLYQAGNNLLSGVYTAGHGFSRKALESQLNTGALSL